MIDTRLITTSRSSPAMSAPRLKAPRTTAKKANRKSAMANEPMVNARRSFLRKRLAKINDRNFIAQLFLLTAEAQRNTNQRLQDANWNSIPVRSRGANFPFCLLCAYAVKNSLNFGCHGVRFARFHQDSLVQVQRCVRAFCHYG